MRKIITTLLTLLLLILLGCAQQNHDTITQTSTINALLSGIYDGSMTCQELLTYGDFGIGTFDKLDGEMIIFNGKIFQVKSDGRIESPALDITTPFATVCHFDPDTSFKISANNFTQLEHALDQIYPNQNTFYAIQIEGIFTKMKTRSVPAQEKPYPKLTEITKNQPEFEFENVQGTLIGFRCPPFVQNINVPGYHLHFMDDTRSMGGHVLNFALQEGICQVDQQGKFSLLLPEDDGFQKVDLSQDQSKNLMQVEK